MKVGVFGLGRFGYFWASVLAKKYDVIVYNRNPERPAPPGVERVSLEELGRADVLFMCVAISSFKQALLTVVPHLGKDTLLVDTCSVKVFPVQWMREVLPPDQPCLGTHPMFGPDSGKNGVTGLPVVVSAVPEFDSFAREWEQNFADMGMKVISMTADEHDKEAAYSQGITHFIGRVLKDLDLKTTEIGTLGYNKVLEVVEQTCNDPYQLFVDLQHFNPYTKAMRRNLAKALGHMMDALDKAIDE